MRGICWLFFLACLLLGYSNAYAQTILLQGTVLDQQTQAPVPFATLGIRNKPYGSVADEQGTFRFTVPATALAAEEQLLIT